MKYISSSRVTVYGSCSWKIKITQAFSCFFYRVIFHFGMEQYNSILLQTSTSRTKL